MKILREDDEVSRDPSTPGLTLGSFSMGSDTLIHVNINGTDYTYKSVEMNVYDLYNKVTSIAKYSAGKALAFLKKNSIGGRTESVDISNLGYDESLEFLQIVSDLGIPYKTNTEGTLLTFDNADQESVVERLLVSFKDMIGTAAKDLGRSVSESGLDPSKLIVGSEVTFTSGKYQGKSGIVIDTGYKSTHTDYRGEFIISIAGKNVSLTVDQLKESSINIATARPGIMGGMTSMEIPNIPANKVIAHDRLQVGKWPSRIDGDPRPTFETDYNIDDRVSIPSMDRLGTIVEIDKDNQVLVVSIDGSGEIIPLDFSEVAPIVDKKSD